MIIMQIEAFTAVQVTYPEICDVRFSNLHRWTPFASKHVLVVKHHFLDQDFGTVFS